MAERVYTSEGMVLRRRGSGEANILISLFTEELGLIEASAQSGRTERSKLRFGLSALAHGTYSLVPGERTFKVIGAAADGVFASGGSRAAAQAIGKVSALLLRLIPRGEPLPALYAFVAGGFTSLEGEADTERIAATEGLLVLRALHELGYVQHADEFSPFLKATAFDQDLIATFLPLRSKAVKAINAALSASGL